MVASFPAAVIIGAMTVHATVTLQLSDGRSKAPNVVMPGEGPTSTTHFDVTAPSMTTIRHGTSLRPASGIKAFDISRIQPTPDRHPQSRPLLPPSANLRKTRRQ
jgi:hypothetical protein